MSEFEELVFFLEAGKKPLGQLFVGLGHFGDGVAADVQVGGLGEAFYILPQGGHAIFVANGDIVDRAYVIAQALH